MCHSCNCLWQIVANGFWHIFLTELLLVLRNKWPILYSDLCKKLPRNRAREKRQWRRMQNVSNKSGGDLFASFPNWKMHQKKAKGFVLGFFTIQLLSLMHYILPMIFLSWHAPILSWLAKNKESPEKKIQLREKEGVNRVPRVRKTILCRFNSIKSGTKQKKKVALLLLIVWNWIKNNTILLALIEISNLQSKQFFFRIKNWHFATRKHTKFDHKIQDFAL